MTMKWQRRWFLIFGTPYPQSPWPIISPSQLLGKLRLFVDGEDPHKDQRWANFPDTHGIKPDARTMRRMLVGDPQDARDDEIIQMYYNREIPSKQQVRDALLRELQGRLKIREDLMSEFREILKIREDNE